jgi:hypothetical protein
MTGIILDRWALSRPQKVGICDAVRFRRVTRADWYLGGYEALGPSRDTIASEQVFVVFSSFVRGRFILHQRIAGKGAAELEVPTGTYERVTIREI